MSRPASSLVAVLLFASLLGLMQWLAGASPWKLPLQTLAVFLAAFCLFRALPWARLARLVRPGSRFFAPVLFLILVSHFVEVLSGETRRVLMARTRTVLRRRGAGWFTSLGWATTALIERALVRAERFWAALALRGLGE